MAKYKKGLGANHSESVFDNEDDLPPLPDHINEGDLAVTTSIFNLNGKPFSAVHRETLPRYFVEPVEKYDEFGFELTSTTEIDYSPELEPSQQRMRWLAHIQFTHDSEDELCWKNVDVERLRGEKLDEMLRANGIPHSFRPFLWARFSGAVKKKAAAGCSYEKINNRCEREAAATTNCQIEKDLLRTMPKNLCFSREDCPAIGALRRILRTVAFMYPDFGYCQGMGTVVSTLLLVCDEETTFWTVCALIEDILPSNFYSHSLLGVQADERVVKHLMCIHTPKLVNAIKSNDVDITMITINWLLTIFANAYPTRTVCRLWDYIFVHGSVVTLRTVIAMFKMCETELLTDNEESNCQAELFNAIAKLPSSIKDCDTLIDEICSLASDITSEQVTELRKKYQGMLMTHSGMLFEVSANANLPKQTVTKRKSSRPHNYLMHFFSSHDSENDPKTKNIRHTEMIVDLRNAIHQICNHFSLCPEKYHKPINTQTDYREESHFNDFQQFVSARREGRKRARALLDFQRQEEDELGFQKNELITILSEKDEHCWIGEVNGQVGWFPAKFVEIIDERGKNYCIFGDEAVTPAIGDIVRGPLSHAILNILNHGFHSAHVANFVTHPWLFFEMIVEAMQNQTKVVNSKVMLCDTFKLDQDGKILTPEELLYRAVHEINQSHKGVAAQFDIKLRSLIAYGLNEQCLHLWLEILCTNSSLANLRERHYSSESFIRTPAWKQIKCELRVLAQFAFNLSIEREIQDQALTVSKTQSAKNLSKIKKSVSLDISSKNGEPLKNGVQDMLIKHHLFSWDL